MIGKHMTFKMSHFMKTAVSIFVVCCYSAPQVASNTPVYTCPTGWTLLNEACYQFFDEYRSWEDAEATCQYNFGSHLVSIHNRRENMFIIELSQPFPRFNRKSMDLWIGLTKPAQLKQFIWTDGSPVAFTNFEWLPRAKPNRRICTRIHTLLSPWSFRVGEWRTPGPCSNEHRFICELRLAAREFSPNDEISKLPIKNILKLINNTHVFRPNISEKPLSVFVGW